MAAYTIQVLINEKILIYKKEKYGNRRQFKAGRK